MQQLEVFPLLILPSAQTRTTQPAPLHIILLFAHSPPLYSLFFFHLNSPSTSGFYWEKGGKLTDALYSWLHMHRDEEGKTCPSFLTCIYYVPERKGNIIVSMSTWGEEL
jgi:hypothetical protein